MRTSENVDKVLPALAVVKSKLQAVTKGANNPYFKSKYADLNTHLDAVEPLLEENGLVLFQPTEATTEGNVVKSVVVHPESGQFVESSIKLVGEADMQKVGSAVTYGRRYTLGSLLSMKAEDDDGESAVGRGKKTTTTKSAAAKPATKKASGKPSFRDRKKQTPTKSAPVASTTTDEDGM